MVFLYIILLGFLNNPSLMNIAINTCLIKTSKNSAGKIYSTGVVSEIEA